MNLPPVSASTLRAPRLALLGVPRFLPGDGKAQVLGPRLAPLVAIVVLGAATARAQVASLLYPELEPAGARRNLRQLLHKQRYLLAAFIDDDGEQMQLRAGVEVDALAAVDSAAASPLPPARLLGELRYDSLPQLQSWLDGERERRQSLWRDAVAATVERDERDGLLDNALAGSERLVLDQPISEHAHRRVMRLHYLRGDRAAALGAFDRCERILKDELGARPGDQTLALLSQIERVAVVPFRTPSRRVPPTVTRPPLLIGRSVEWRALNDAWEDGVGVAMVGEAGMGKTRMLGDFVQSLGDTDRVLVVSARPGDERLPQSMLSRLLRSLLARRTRGVLPGLRQELAHLLPEFGSAESPGRSNSARFMNAVDVLVADAIEDGLLAIVVDDLQFADDASLEATQHLAAQAGRRWIVASRDVDLGAAGQALLEAIATTGPLVTIRLAPLGRDDVHALVASLGLPEFDADTWADVLHRRAGGNPMYLLESIKAALTQSPIDGAPVVSLSAMPVAPTVGALILRRITGLSAGAVRLARCAAVSGQDFSASLATHVLGVEPLDLADGWAELESAQVLLDGAFAHDLIYEAALRSVPKPLAGELHARIARFLEGAGASAVRVAPHAQAGSLHELAGDRWRQAGDVSERAGRLVEAGRHFELAAASYERLGDTDRALAACRRQAEVLITHGYDVPVDALLEKLQASAKTPAQRIHALYLQAEQMLRQNKLRAATDFGRTALALLEINVDPAMQLSIACLVANAHAEFEEPDEALAVLQPCELWVRSSGSPQDRFKYEGLLGMVLERKGRRREALQRYQNAIDVARVEQRPEDLAMLTAAVGVTHHALGEQVRALELGQQAARLMLDNQGGLRSMSLMQIELTIARCLADLGRYGESIVLLENLCVEFERNSAVARQLQCQLYLAFVFVRLGQWARASALFPDDALFSQPSHVSFALSARCELARAQGTNLESLIDRSTAFSAHCTEASRHEAALWQCRLLPDVDALQVLTAAVAWANANERPGHALAALVRASETARASAQPLLAASHAMAAMALGRTCHGWRQYRGDLFLEVALALDAVGDDAGATEALEAGLDWLRITLTQVPAEFRPSFLERNPTNAQLLQLGRQRQAIQLSI